MAKQKIAFGGSNFTEWMNSIEAVTDTVYLCHDVRLLQAKDRLEAEVADLDTELAMLKAEHANTTGERSLADDDPTEEATAKLAEKKRELAEAVKNIEDASTELEIRAVSQAFMVRTMEKLDEKTSLYTLSLHVIAEALGITVEETTALSEKLSPSTWEYLTVQINEKAVQVNQTVDLATA